MVVLSPDYVILLGARSLVSLTGILLIAGGNWRSDRQWDQEGPSDTTTSSSDDDNAEKAPDAPDSTSGDYHGMEDGGTIAAPSSMESLRKLDISYPALVGWLLLAASYALKRDNYSGVETDLFVWLTMLLVVMIGVVQTVLVRNAVLSRAVYRQRHFFMLTLGLGFLVEAALTDIQYPAAPVWMTPFGAICVMIGPVILWHSRKMGHTYEIEGRPNAQPVVYNVGGLVIVTGWFFFWMGLNVIASASPSAWYLPVFFTWRTVVSYVGAAFITAVLWMTSYALDESPEQYANGLSDESCGFGVYGQFFGTVSEVGPAVGISWFCFSIAAFLPFYSGWVPVLLFVAITVQGVLVGVIHQIAVRTGVPSGRPELLTKWTRFSYAGFAVIVLLLTFCGALFHTWNTLVRALAGALGAVLFCYGQHLLQQDRKRGTHWMETATVNPNAVVFSHGVPLFALGMLLLAYALTIP